MTAGGLGAPILAVISDVDGTLLAPDKSLSPRAIAAVAALHAAGVPFTLASARPPAAFRPLVEALTLRAPLAAFNGGTIVNADLTTVLEAHQLPLDAARRVLDILDARGIDAWVFSRGDWLRRDPPGEYVPLERRTLGYDAVIVDGFDDLSSVDKIVGASPDAALLAATEADMQREFGTTLSVARSQTYYLDITHPSADKGYAARALARHLGVPLAQVAALGDMSNDLPMLDAVGLPIVMGQATAEVRAHARCVSASNADEGFADAIERFVLPRLRRP